MTFNEFKTQWGVDGMPIDKQRLALAAWKAGAENMKARCIEACGTVQLRGSNEWFASAWEVEKLISAQPADARPE